MQITGDLNDEYLIMSMISRHVLFSFTSIKSIAYTEIFMNQEYLNCARKPKNTGPIGKSLGSLG